MAQKRRAAIRTSLDCSFRKVDRIESSKESEPVSTSGMSEIALRLLLLTILQRHHPPPALPPPVGNSSRLFAQCQPPYASCCTVLLYFSRCCTVRLKLFSLLFWVCLLFMYYLCAVLSRVRLCGPQNCNLPGSSVHGDSPDKHTGVGCHFLPQGVFPTQGSNPGLPHCRRILYQLSH